MEDRESTTMDQELQKQLKELECPFTWSMNEVAGKTIDTRIILNEEEELIPILKIFRNLMKIFLDLHMSKKNTNCEHSFESIISNAEKLDDLVLQVKE